jgi:hypothetical protein
VIGVGTMDAGIAICALDVGLNVIVLEQDEAALQRGQQRVAEHYQSSITAGKMKAAVAAASQARLSPTTDWALLDRADLVIEAVFEDMAVKQNVFRKIDAHARPGAVLATNTSYHPPHPGRQGNSASRPADHGQRGGAAAGRRRASRPSDIDVVLVQGYGFARLEGGPVFWARQQDPAQLAQDLQRLAHASGHGFVLGDLSVLLNP